MTTQDGRAFTDWLRAELRGRQMSQRQLAQRSGVDHSTISRLVRGGRMPTLGTATRLARGLRELHDDADPAQYLGLVASGSTNPTARVSYSLGADDALSEAQVRQIMDYYLAVRMRRSLPPPEAAARRPERPLFRSTTVRSPGQPIAEATAPPPPAGSGALRRPRRPHADEGGSLTVAQPGPRQPR